jgi:16S rRNA (guanine966-N2)-methyltransferase
MSELNLAMEKTEVRIISGSLRGRKLQCIVHPGLRPTPQFVREALFSILGNAIPDRIFFDLFSGTGVVGLEAISRGASRAVLLEKDAKQSAEILKAVERFNLRAQAQVLRADVYRWAERWIAPKTGPVNLFLSPPFPDLAGEKGEAFLNCVNELLKKAPPQSVLTIQAEDGFPLDRLPEPDQWDIRKYGRNLLLFRVKEEAFDPEAKSETVGSDSE